MKKRWLITLIIAYIAVRTYIATLSSYGFYHGWNEGHYSLIAKHYFSGSLWEQISYPGSAPISSVPPLFSYLVYVSFKLFGTSDISARLVSILSEVIAVSGVYMLARELYNEKTACIAAIIYIFIPWNILWYGRAQTDPLMTALMTLAIALYVRAYKRDKSMLPFGITLGLAVFTKQPALAALPVLFLWSYFEGIKKKQIINSIVFFSAGMIPLLIWLSHYLVKGNTAFVSYFIYGELAYRSEPFSDMVRVVLFTAAGVMPVMIFAAYQVFKERDVKNILAIWLLIYGAFVLIRTRPSHEYYSLPLMAPVAIMAGAGIIGISRILDKRHALTLLMAAVLVSTIPVAYILLSYSGDAGYTATEDAGIFLKNYMKDNPDDYSVLVQMTNTPQMAWYFGLIDEKERVYSIPEDLSVQYLDEMISNFDKKTVFLVSDNVADTALATKYEKLYESRYKWDVLNLGGYFGSEQGLQVYKLR